jgi:hypothetical protein
MFNDHMRLGDYNVAQLSYRTFLSRQKVLWVSAGHGEKRMVSIVCVVQLVDS